MSHAASSTALSLEPKEISIPFLESDGGTTLLTIELKVYNVSNLKKFYIKFGYDTYVLELIGAKMDEFFYNTVSGWRGWYYDSYVELSRTFSGSATMFRYYFRVLHAGSTQVRLMDTILVDEAGSAIPHTVSECSVEVIPLESWIDDKYAELSAKYNELLADFQTLNNTYWKLLGNYTSLNTMHQQLRESYSSLQNDYGTLSSDYNKLNAEFSNLKSDYGKLESQYESLQRDYNEQINQINQLNEQINQLQEIINTYEQEKANLQTQVDHLLEDIQILQNENNSLKTIQYLLIAATIILLIASIFLVLKRRKPAT